MTTKILTAILIVSLSVIYALPTGPYDVGCDDNSLCIGKAAGYYPYIPDDTKYYYCDEHYVNVGCQECGAPHTYYSKECDACLARIDVSNKNCPVTPTTPDSQGQDPKLDCAPKGFCAYKPDAIFQNPSKKSQFFSCVNGTATLCQTCPSGLVFSNACQKCLQTDIQYSSDCPIDSVVTTPAGESCPYKFCDTKADGDYEKAANSGKYYTCTEGSCIVNNCPGQTVFVAACNNRCENVYYSKPEDCPTASETSTFPPLPKCHPLNFCAYKSDGSFPKNPNVEDNEYYICANDICFVQNCPGGLIFNPIKKYCDFPSSPKPKHY